VNAQARVTPGTVSPTVTIVIWIVVAIAALVLLVVVLIIVAILIKYWTVLRKRAAQTSDRTMTLRAQQGTQEPSTTPSYALQQPHHTFHSLSSEATHTLENSVLHSTAPHPLDSELQNASPPTYSASSQYPVYIDKGLQSQSTSSGDEELPPPYIP